MNIGAILGGAIFFQITTSAILFFGFGIKIGEVEPVILQLIAPILGMTCGWWLSKK